MKLIVVILTIWFSIGTTSSLTYPIFGTKRYHRGSSPRTDMTQHILKQPVYEDGYLTNNGYYYYPHHEYHSYGMPTYRGEYKPKAYYYSSGPSYNYYNDREPVSNPLDDLHEEILQENEQERQTDLMAKDDYEDEDYYVEPSEKIHDTETTNNFLRNMMEYNKQKEKQHRLQQLQYRQREQQQLAQAQIQQREEEQRAADDDYFSEIEVNPDDYQFEPKGEDNFDLQKYWDSELNMNKGDAMKSDVYRQREPASVNRLNNDRDVEELKSLSKQEPDNYDEDYRKRYHGKVKQSNANSFSQQKSPSASSTQTQKDHEDDYSPVDYDDGSWINWDRKRSSLPAKSQSLNMKNRFQNTKRQSLVTAKKELTPLPKDSSLQLAAASTTAAPAISLGQKEKYPADESYSAALLDQKNEDHFNSNKQSGKSQTAVDQSIYDTIKQMITIEQQLKKTGSKMHKRFISDDGSVVKQLDNLRKHKN